MTKKLLLFVFLIAGAMGLYAQTISGTVTDLSGTGITNYQVYIMNNDSMNPYSSSTYTAGGGAYSFSNVPSSSSGFVVYVYDCQQSMQTVNLAANLGTANFSICTSNPSSCTALFNYMADSINANLIHFTDVSTGNPTNWMWDFGDGNTSSLQNPFHSYASSGTYNVSLIITGNNCQSSYNANVIVSGSVLSYTVEGSIYANNLVVTAVDVDLFDVTNNIVAYSTTVSPMGTYNFANVVAGTYIVLATPDSTAIPGYAPTYYGNVIFWSAATQLNVNANQSGIDIVLTVIPATPGNGSISGTVGTGSKSSVENLNVYLTDDNNSDALVASTTTNSNGEYILSNIADGTFKIWVNVSGKTTTPITVILDNGNAESEGNDFIMTNNTIVPKTTSIESNSIEGSMNLYPNPVINTLNVEMNIAKAAVCTFNVYSISGQLMLSQQLNVSNGESLIRINTNALAQGTYILRIENNVNQTLQKLFVK